MDTFTSTIMTNKLDLNLLKEKLDDKYLVKLTEGIDLKIEELKFSNVVLTLHDDQKWDRNKLIEYLNKHNYSYKVPKSFSGISIRLKVLANKYLTFILFETGNCLIVGFKPAIFKHEILVSTIKIIQDVVKESGARVGSPNFVCSISNKVYSFKLGVESFPAALADWYNKIPDIRKNFEYNAVMFPGATLRIPNHSAVLLIFNSRKCILTGGKNHPTYFRDSLEYLATLINKLKFELNKVSN
jgi:TATA-box binding protein (TBP) (component of TFIID and TFIIIB)